jgi:trimethylamine--corrinoid protein Co-methyltransferase
MEHAFGTLMAALDGANLIHDVGYLGQGLLSNPASIVMCDEIISYVKRVIRGFDMTREKLGVDVIRQVGPAGSFLTNRHTAKHYREELWQPKLANRDTPGEWQKQGAASYGQVVTQKALEILKQHQPEPLTDEVQQKVDDIARRAEETLGDMQFVA